MTDTRAARKRYRHYLKDELAAAAVYRAMAEHSDAGTSRVLRGLAEAEERHAAHWADRLEELGEDRPGLATAGGGMRVRLFVFLARRFGAKAVTPLLERQEAKELGRYDRDAGASDQMAAEERVHAQVVANLYPGWRTRTSGALRAGTFGANDGLVSNLALVMGVAGGQAADGTILLAGLAGLVGGGLSMGIGEWISVTSQRELWEGEVELDAEHLEDLPDDAANELALLFRTRGLPRDQADEAARAVLGDRDQAASVLATGKLGFDPQALGSPWTAAATNFTTFVAGAAVPVAPYLVTGGDAAFVSSLVAAALALFLVGATISLLTYRPMVRSGLRQLAIGAGAAAVTFAVGRVIGAGVA